MLRVSLLAACIDRFGYLLGLGLFLEGAVVSSQDVQHIPAFAVNHVSLQQDKPQREPQRDPAQVEKMKAAGVQIIEPTEQEHVRLETLLKQLRDPWAKEIEKKGLPGRKVLNAFVELVEKYESLSPFKKK